MTNTIINDLNRRYAVKKFDPNQKVSQSDIDLLVETFRLTPSSLGLQPRKLLYLTNYNKRKEMAPFCRNDSQILESTGIFILCRRTDLSERFLNKWIQHLIDTTRATREQLSGYETMITGYFAKMNDQEKIIRAEKQVMIALGNMITVCATEKIDSCPIEGFQKEEINKILELEEK